MPSHFLPSTASLSASLPFLLLFFFFHPPSFYIHSFSICRSPTNTRTDTNFHTHTGTQSRANSVTHPKLPHTHTLTPCPLWVVFGAILSFPVRCHCQAAKPRGREANLPLLPSLPLRPSPALCSTPLLFLPSPSPSLPHALSPLLSYHLLSYHLLSYHLLSSPIISFPLLSSPLLSYHLLSYHLLSSHLLSSPLISSLLSP